MITYPPMLPDSLKPFWAALIYGRDMTDAREVIEIIDGILSRDTVADRATSQLIAGMIWERKRAIAWELHEKKFAIQEMRHDEA